MRLEGAAAVAQQLPMGALVKDIKQARPPSVADMVLKNSGIRFAGAWPTTVQAGVSE